MHGLDTSNVSSRVESSHVEFEPYYAWENIRGQSQVLSKFITAANE